MPSESVSIKVVAKVRALLDGQQSKNILKISGDKVTIEGGGKEQTFNFDYAYGPQIRTVELYREACDGLVQRSLMGYNTSIITLGAADSGKTQLLTGSEEEPGIVPSLIKSLFGYMNESKAKKEYFVTVSGVEIFNEELTDMLNPHPNDMKIREHPQLGIFVDGLSELVTHTEDDLFRLFTQATRARRLGTKDSKPHNPRPISPRSNGIFNIHIDQKEIGSTKGVGIRSTITIADLAGVESEHGMQNVEKVIEAVKKGGHVPYRESKVTRLLQESLGGNAVSVVLLTLSPSASEYQHSHKALMLAQAVRGMKNHVKINLNESQNLINDIREDITRLRNKLTKSSEVNKEDVLKMENLVRDLQIAKKQTWPEKERMSQRHEEERKTNLANRGILEWVMDSARRTKSEVQERIMILQKEKDKLTSDYKDRRNRVDSMKDQLQKKIADYSKLAESGKVNENETKKRVNDIHDAKERLKQETEVLKDIKRKLQNVQDQQRSEKEVSQGEASLRGNAELRQAVEAESRLRQEEENKAAVAEELERSKLETEQTKAEIQMKVAQGKTYTKEEASKLEMELVECKGEKSVVALQIQCLQQEKELLSTDLSRTCKRHAEEMEIQQLQHFQTFREYREMFEEQKAVLEQRYRGLLEDAIQDAVYLSSRNAELMEENQSHKQEIAELKDKLTIAEGQKPRSSKK